MKTIVLDNDHEFIWSGVRRNSSTGASEPATGLIVTAHISATDGGAAIDADLAKSLTERSSQPGEYYAVVDGDALREHLDGDPSLVGLTVWEVFGDGVNVQYSVPRKVVARRRA